MVIFNAITEKVSRNENCKISINKYSFKNKKIGQLDLARSTLLDLVKT